METHFSQFCIYFITLFLCIDVPGIAPLFIAMTCDFSPQKQLKIVNKTILTSLIILLIFAVSGLSVLNVFGISLAAFKLAGGILLLLLAIEMVLGKIPKADNSEYEDAGSDIAVFPLALPLLSGPATISMLIVFMKQAEGNLINQSLVIFALLINMIIAWLTLRFANKITLVLGRSGINVLTKIFGILMAALACQFIISGVAEAFKLSICQ